MKKNLSSVKLRNYISKFQVGTYKKNTVKTAGFIGNIPAYTQRRGIGHTQKVGWLGCIRTH